MKRLIMKLGLAAAVVLMAGQAYAAGSNTVAVTATVLGRCAFNAGAGALAFGNLDPTSALDATAAPTNPTFWCTKGAAFALTDDDGVNELVANGNRMIGTILPSEYIPYSMTYTPSAALGAGKTTPITLTLTGTVLNADYINVSADTYSDTVTITVTP